MGGTTSTSTPMHGLGYGLPLSRLYARYFGGDIKVASCDGYGTDTFIYLRALESDARETLPIFNASSMNKIRDTANQVEDWTPVLIPFVLKDGNYILDRNQSDSRRF